MKTYTLKTCRARRGIAPANRRRPVWPLVAFSILLWLMIGLLIANLSGENVDAGNPAELKPVTAWPWEK